MILCCGEALIDMLPRETTKGEKGFAPYAGGAIFNTAIALGRLGVPTAFFTGLADDMMGEILIETLKASNVDASPCAIVVRTSVNSTITRCVPTDANQLPTVVRQAATSSYDHSAHRSKTRTSSA